MSWDWLPLLTGPAAAVVGAGTGYRLTSPKLSFAVDRVSISSSRVASTLPVPVDEDLKRLVRSFPSILSQINNITAPERVYVTYLEILRQEVDDIQRNLVASEAAAIKLRELSVAEDFSGMIDIYLSVHTTLWAWASGENKRGNNLFSTEKWSLPTDETYRHELYEVEFAKASGYHVVFPGVVQSYFLWETPNRAQALIDRDKLFAERVATALATHRKADLVEYFGGVREILTDAISKAEVVRSHLLGQLAKFARLQIEVLVSNSGNTGVSISPEFDCNVMLEGYSVGSTRLDGDVVINLESVSQAAADSIKAEVADTTARDLRVDEIAPILIRSGETVRVVGWSKIPIASLPVAEVLNAAYAGAERYFKLNITEFQQSLFSRQPSRTRKLRKIPFRDLAALRRASAVVPAQT